MSMGNLHKTGKAFSKASLPFLLNRDVRPTFENAIHPFQSVSGCLSKNIFMGNYTEPPSGVATFYSV